MKNKKLVLVIPLVLFALLVPVKMLQAAVLTVTTTEDNVNGSLRAAISIANNNSEDDTIHLPAGTYRLTGTAGDDNNSSGDIDIDTAHSVVIIGEGMSSTIIDGDEKDRVFHILNGHVSISGVTIQNGRTPDAEMNEEKPGTGGGICNNSTLVLNKCKLFKNHTGHGFGYLDGKNGGDGGGIYNTGSLELIACNIIDNNTGRGSDSGGIFDTAGDGGNGGGIYNSGSMTLKNCMINTNYSGHGGSSSRGGIHINLGNGGRGGGIYNCGQQTIIGCQISSNTTGDGGKYGNDGDCGGKGGDGGGIFNIGAQTISNCKILYNQTGHAYYTDCEMGRNGNGGGLCNESGNTIISNTYIAYNRVESFSWQSLSGNGGGIFNGSVLTLINSTLAFNGAGSEYTGYNEKLAYGGGFCNLEGAHATITNCTISNNQIRSQDIDFAPNGNGGGIFNSGTLELTSCTVCQNWIGYEGEEPEDFSWFGYGGGIYNAINGTLKARNTIIANNQSPALENGPDFWGELDSQGFNLIEDTNHCIINGVLTGNITGVNPLLGLLADNGGLTYTHALLTNSPAIDAGNRSGLNTDQRGYIRPVDIPGISNVSDGSDIGAYELEIPIIPPRFYTISGKVTENGTGLAGVTMTFTGSDGSIVTCSTNEQGYYSHTVQEGWSGQVRPSKTGYTFSPSNRNYTDINSNLPQQHYTAALNFPPWISLSRTQLNFGAQNPGYTSGKETFFIDNSGGSILTWSSSHDVNWISCNPLSGNNRGEVTVTLNASGLSPGIYTTVITVEAAEAVNTPQFVKVNLTVYDGSTLHPPFGCFDTPLDHSTVSGSIPVTGWALDNIGIETVKIYSSGPGKDKKMTYIGDAIFVEGARPDVEERYYDYPGNFKAGWGYMMLTNFLANGGNGTYNIHAFAHDIEGNQVSLGTKTIICDNANAVKPFGAIDTPGQGGTASGRDFINFGWALTPLPNTILKDGSTITVWVDGKAVGQPVYNRYREDIATLFPGYNNSEGAVGYFSLDTTSYTNGVHTIQWTVTDDAGNTDGIGSRYFSIQNPGGSTSRYSYIQTSAMAEGAWTMIPEIEGSQIPFNNFHPVHIKKGYDLNLEVETVYPDESGNVTIEIKELERLEISFSTPTLSMSPLPVGSNLDEKTGEFTWQPGVGFLGKYRLEFIERDELSYYTRKSITVQIIPEN